MADNQEKKKRPKLIPDRTPMPEQDPQARNANFEEVNLGYTEELALKESVRCILCPRPPCERGCPVNVPIKDFIELVQEGKFLEAADKIKERNMLPAICGRVCPQETQCEMLCVVGKKFDPVAIGRLERFVADYAFEHGEAKKVSKPKPTGKKAVVVGSGPAGLTCASDLALLGHEVTLLEALHEPGGVLFYGIPEFRLPKATVLKEVESLKDLGVQLKTSMVVGKVATVDDLIEQYDSVFIGTGAGLPWFMEIDGENLNGVYSANEFLTRTNLMRGYSFPSYDTPIKVGKRVAVVGGGNVAMDAVRTAKRLGAEEAIIIYRRSEEEMPARVEEVHHAKDEGIRFEMLTNPTRIIDDGKGWVKAIECVRMELGEADDSGRRRPVPMEGSEFQIPVDAVVMSIGTGANPLVPQSTTGLDLNRRGYIVADEASGATSKPGVYAGGDIVTGAATVILAMGAGRNAAAAMHSYMMGEDGQESSSQSDQSQQPVSS